MQNKGEILTETNGFGAQKDCTFVLSMADLNTIHAILMMAGHSLL